ncbi:MAG: hypothetical protein JXA09_04155, partial [Anaerolineae bacterium]|nr:hypothetical protein [Anaerolineae bacterium]
RLDGRHASETLAVRFGWERRRLDGRHASGTVTVWSRRESCRLDGRRASETLAVRFGWERRRLDGRRASEMLTLRFGRESCRLDGRQAQQWEQALIDDCADYRHREVFGALSTKFRLWQACKLTHEDMDEAIHEAIKENRELYHLFGESRSFLVKAIQCDVDWFAGWLAGHPPLEGVTLVQV